MHPQAVRRTPEFFAKRARLRAIARWYRGLDVATQADAALGFALFFGFLALGLVLPAVHP